MAQPQGSRLAGKTTIVTGGGSGFGAATSIRFAQEGANVVVCDINEAGGQNVVSQDPSRMVFQKMDVTSLADWKATIDFAVSKFGRVDVLVNNAGTTYKNKLDDDGDTSQPSIDVTIDEFERVFNVNVKSIFYASQTFIPQLIKQGPEGGAMINISSTGAQRPRPGLVWYNASKGAVSNATKGLAAEYGPQQVRVNNVCPLLTGTGLFEMFTGVPDTPENREKFISNVPLGRLAETSDIANMVLYLASDEAKFISGTDFIVDGGKSV
ncbi:hypothetical protein FQN57_000658 [Myotisia sp. PD_48]|nr:hypothetical protein FQN57_000658 [Myotisia sp. PD_48]